MNWLTNTILPKIRNIVGAKEAPDKMTAEVALGYFMGEKQERIVVVNSGPCRLKKPDGSEFVIQSNVREMEQGKAYQVSVAVLNAPVDFSQQTSLTGSCQKAYEKLSYGLQVRQEMVLFNKRHSQYLAVCKNSPGPIRRITRIRYQNDISGIYER